MRLTTSIAFLCVILCNLKGTLGQLTPPIILGTDVQSSQSILVSWTGIEGAQDGRSYLLRYRSKPPSRWVNINTTDTSYLVDGLIPDSLYTFEVKVVRGADESIPSLENYARTSEATGWEGVTNTTQGPIIYPSAPASSGACEPVQVPLCSPVPYNFTILPNLLGYTSQSAISDEVNKWIPILASACSDLVGFFVCALYVPPCTVLEIPIAPCRGVCEMIKRDCQATVDATEGFDWPEELKCEYFPSQNDSNGEICFSPDAPPPGLGLGPDPGNGSGQPGGSNPFGFGPEGPPDHCEPIPGDWACDPAVSVLPYNYTQFPNVLGHGDVSEMMYGSLMFTDLIESNCSPLVGFFMCSLLVSPCAPPSVIVPPCRELCELTRDQCQSSDVEVEWPEQLNCDELPSESELFCFGISGFASGPDGQDPDGRGPDGAGPKGPDREGNTTDGGGLSPGQNPDIQEGTATCEPLSTEARYICPGIEYTETIFPNSLGHRDQSEAIDMIHSQAELIAIEDCPVGLFLCVLAFPPCKRFGENQENAIPLLPCREECAYVETSCTDLVVDFNTVFQDINRWGGNLDCSNFPEVYSFPPLCWEVNNDFLKEPTPEQVDGGSSDGQCSSDISDVCRDLGFKVTAYPNVFNHVDVTDVIKAFEDLQPLIDSGCSEDITTFLCAAHFPVCNGNGETVMPCHETCRQVWKPCKDTAAQMGIDRPKVFGCSKNYLSAKEGEVCYESFVPPTETPKLAGITRDPNDVELELMAEDDQAKYYEIEVFSPGTVSKIRVEVIDEPSTTVVIPYLDPETQYYVTINTANAFGKSDKITLTVEKISGVKCMDLEIDMCSNLGYESGLADGSPNLLGHLEQAEAYTLLQQFQPLMAIGCSPDIQRFLCWLFAPGCSVDMKQVEPPCRDTCENARFGCETLMNSFGYDWPDILDCEQFPFKNDTEASCEGGEGISTFETPGSEGTEYQCTKLFADGGAFGPQPTWVDPEGNEVGEGESSTTAYSTVINQRTTRLTLPDDAPGEYTCVAGDLKTAQVVEVQGSCHSSSDHPICKQHFDSFFLPNSLNQTSRTDAMLSVNAFMPILASNCSEYLSRFACYLYLPNKGCQNGPSNATQMPEEGYGRTNTPCRELCWKVQLDCEAQINELGFLWPEQASCDDLPAASENQCDHFGISEQDLYTESTAEPTISPDENTTESTFVTGFTDLPEDYTALPTEIYTELPENYTDLTESYYTDTPENYTELVTLEPEYVTEMVNETDSGENGTIGEQETCASSVKPRRYDIEDLGSDCLFRGWADVQAQGAANDYCRFITNDGPQYLSCALAGATDDYVYTSPNASEEWFDAGHLDTWYMRDEDGDGRDDYCRCVGTPPDTVVRCMKAGEEAFKGTEGDFDIEGSTDCHYNKVNPYFGAQLYAAP